MDIRNLKSDQFQMLSLAILRIGSLFEIIDTPIFKNVI